MSVKFCSKCGEVKNLEECYYKAGKSWQKYCKACHNKNRYKYNLTPSNYVKKPTGFNKLDVSVKNGIIYDVYIKIKYKEIARKYGIRYDTLLNWKKKGSIPEYEDANDEEQHINMNAT